MDDRFRRSDEERLIATLNELDAAKALTRQLRAELGDGISAVARSGGSRDCLCAFETVKRVMNEATLRYRRAVDSFNVFCQKRREAVADVTHATLLDGRKVGG
jgi:hypothetical protein